MQTFTNKSNLTVGNVQLKSIVTLAPMAGITDSVLRQIIRMFSPDALLFSEMISSEATVMNPSSAIIHYHEIEQPLVFQLSGHKPVVMAKAAKILESRSTMIDINMGCPAPKIVKNGDGSALMKNPALASEIISAVKQAVNVPVTVKFRLGWDCETMNYIEFAQMAEKAGADAITIHGRTRTQMYSGQANWNAIAEIKKNVSIPVIGNGDITSVEKALECLELSNCDGLAIGRGVLGDPELISRIESCLKTGELLPEPSIQRRIELVKLHLEKEIAFREEEFGLCFMRKFFAWYIKGIRGASQYRDRLVKTNKIAEVFSIFDEICENAG